MILNRSQENSDPLVTIITLCFNHSKYARESLEGLRRQTYKTTELIIIDDCSSDDSVQIIREWLKTYTLPYRFISHKTNQGICKSLNEGLKYAKGKYVTIYSTDDVWLENKVEADVRLFRTLAPSFGIVYNDAYQIDENSQPFEKTHLKAHYSFSHPPEGWVFSSLMHTNFIFSVLIRKECFDKVGVFDERLCYEDWDMWLRISLQYQIAFNPKLTIKRRIHSKSLTNTLFYHLNVSVLISDFLITKKLLSSNRLSAVEKSFMSQRLLINAQFLYFQSYENAVKCLLQVLRYSLSLRACFLLLLASIRFPPKKAEQVLSYFGKLKRMLKV